MNGINLKYKSRDTGGSGDQGVKRRESLINRESERHPSFLLSFLFLFRVKFEFDKQV